MAQWIEELATKLDDLSQIQRSQPGRRRGLTPASCHLCSTCLPRYAYVHFHTHQVICDKVVVNASI